MDCRVYWGSHGCAHPRGHEGLHECDCCTCADHARDHVENGCVATYPYYDFDDGMATNFWGDDAPRKTLPLATE